MLVYHDQGQEGKLQERMSVHASGIAPRRIYRGGDKIISVSKCQNWICLLLKCVLIIFILNIYVSVHFLKILEGQCLNKNRLTAPLYILLVRN